MHQRTIAATCRQTRIGSIVLLLAMLCQARTLAQTPAQTAQTAASDSAQTIRGTILQIDGDDIVIDLGRARVSESQSLTVYRAIDVRHPITHRVLRDRFAIGNVVVVQAGTQRLRLP